MMKKLLLLTCLPLLIGCASLTRMGAHGNQMEGIYPAVRADIDWIKVTTPGDNDPLLAGSEPIIYFLSIGDLPLAAAVDTVLLPYDSFKYLIREGKKSTSTNDDYENTGKDDYWAKSAINKSI